MVCLPLHLQGVIIARETGVTIESDLTSMTTADITELDQFIILLNEHLPCPFNYRYRIGLHAAITFSLDYGHTITPKEHWLKHRNSALAPLLPRIASDYARVIAELHPQNAADPEESQGI